MILSYKILKLESCNAYTLAYFTMWDFLENPLEK